MSDSNAFDSAAPPFDAAQALTQITRSLRDLKLSPRGNGFELRGKRVVELVAGSGATAATIDVQLARTLALTPQWDRLVVTNTVEQRKLVDEVKKRLAHWERDE